MDPAPAPSPAPDAPAGAGPLEIAFDGEFLHKLEYLNLIARKIFAGLLRAERQSVKKGVSPEFADHRQYVAGDDFRHVDWHLYGRLEELFLKLYREEENLHLTVLLDASQSMDLGERNKFRYGLQVTAALAYIGMANMDSVNVVPFGARMQGGLWRLKGKSRIFRLFDYLKALAPEGTTDLARSFREFITREPRRGIVVVVSDFYDHDGIQQALRFLKYRKHDVYVIHVVDSLEESPPIRGDLRLVDSEGNAWREINVTDGLLARYRAAFEALSAGVESFCVRNEMGFVRARTSVPFDQLVLTILRRGGLIG